MMDGWKRPQGLGLDAPEPDAPGPDAPGREAPRLIYLDNLRWLMVVLVLIFHAGASYGSAVEFWPFHDNVVQFQLGKVTMYAVYFALGAVVYSTNRFEKGTALGTGRRSLPW